MKDRYELEPQARAARIAHQLARDAGKKREQSLFASWGGMPSVAIFRHRDPRIDGITKYRYHKTLGALVEGAKAPSVAEEEADPSAADRVYQAWSTYLRVNTRDTKKYSLLFQENVSYGYRRNLWGLRPLGITTSCLSCALAATWCVQIYRAAGDLRGELIGATVLTSVFFLLWLFRFTANWVRVPADAYAERLAETVDTMTAPPLSPARSGSSTGLR